MTPKIREALHGFLRYLEQNFFVGFSVLNKQGTTNFIASNSIKILQHLLSQQPKTIFHDWFQSQY
jgi:hypothetical protein